MLIDGLLEALCPVVEEGAVGMASCMSTCLGEDASDLVERTHLAQYGDEQFACATACGATVAAALEDFPSAPAKFALAAGGPVLALQSKGLLLHNDGLPDVRLHGRTVEEMGTAGMRAYVTWLDLLTQCDGCDDSLAFGGGFQGPAEAENLMVIQMSLADYVALLLAAVIVALTIFREVRDINIGKLMMMQATIRDRKRREQAAADLSPLELELDQSAKVWGYLLGAPVAVRRYFILPFVLETVVLMVLRMGGDTVSVMLNTMATLFMLELDNFAYDYGLNVKMQQEIERAFRVELGPENIYVLNQSRRWHVLTITLLCVLTPPLITMLPTSFARETVLAMVILGLIGLGEVLEMALRIRRRTVEENISRFSLFFVKISIFVCFKLWSAGQLWKIQTIWSAIH